MIKITTLDNSQISLDDETLQAFKSAVRGEVLTAEHSGYDEARGIFNAMIDKRPALIVCCISPSSSCKITPPCLFTSTTFEPEMVP